jgi:hypothetical protein
MMKIVSCLAGIAMIVGAFVTPAAAIPYTTAYTVRDLPVNGVGDTLDDTVGGGGFWGFVTEIASFQDETFFEFDLGGQAVASQWLLKFSILDGSSGPSDGLIHVPIAHYLASGLSNLGVFGTGTDFATAMFTTLSGPEAFIIDATTQVNAAIQSGDPFIGFRFHDPINLGFDGSSQNFLLDQPAAVLEAVVVPEPSTVTLTMLGLVGLVMRRRRAV